MDIQKTDKEIEGIVRAFLRKIGLEDVRRPDLMTMIVKSKVAFPGLGYRRMPDADLPNKEAQWDSERMTLIMRESIFRGMNRQEPHARITVAHELAHFILGHEGVHNRSLGVSYDDFASAVLYHESEASRCSRVLLAPEHLIPENSEISVIAYEFGLDPEIAALRKREIEAIRRNQVTSQRRLPSKVRDFLRDAKRRGKNIRTRIDDD